MRTCKISWGVFALLLMLPMLAHAQAPDTAWTRILANSSGSWVDMGTGTHDGGGITVGVYTKGGQWDAWVVRFTPDGDTAWTRLIGGAYGEYGRDVVQMGDTGYVMVGKKQPTQNGDYYVWLVALDTSGNTKWQKVTSKTENPWGMTLAADTGFCIVARYETAVGKKNDIVVIRTSSRGDTVWSKWFGGPEDDDPEQVVATPDSGFLVLSNTKSYGLGNGDIYLLKLNKRGDSLWAKTFGGTGWDVAYQIEPTSDGNYIIAGGTYSFGVSGQVYAIKIRPDGSTIWETKVGGPGARAYDCDETPDGGFLLGGVLYPGTNNDMYMVRIDKNGSFMWDKRVGKGVHESGAFIVRLPNGSPLLVGTYGSSGGMFIVKLLPEVLGVDETGREIPQTFALSQNWPNPFNPVTNIEYTVGGFGRQASGVSDVRLVVYDLLGREVAVLVHEKKTPGRYEVEFDASGLASGIYIYRLSAVPAGRQAGRYVECRKMVLLR